MAITSLATTVTALKNGYTQNLMFYKPSSTTTTGAFGTLWWAAGTPAAGAAGSALAGYAPTATSTGALGQIAPQSGNTQYLYSDLVTCATQNVFVIYDRLLTVDGISTTSASTQTFTGTTAPARYGSATNNRLFLEVTTPTTGTSYNLTITYVNQSSATHTAVVVIPTSATLNRVILVQLQAGDTGVASVTSCIMSSVMTAGVLTLVMFNPGSFSYLNTFANIAEETERPLQLAELPIIVSGACLAIMTWASATTSGLLLGKISLIEG